MDKIKPGRRRLIQLYAALLYNCHIRGFLDGSIYVGAGKNLCVPGLNCYSCPGAVAACPLGALQNALTASGHRGIWYIFGILMLFGLTLGRTVCGWLCPVGLMQELAYKLPTVKLKKSAVTRKLSRIKYGVLLIFVILIPLLGKLRGLPVPGFCKYICPAGTLEGAVGLLSHPKNAALFSMLGGIFTWKFLLLVVFAAGSCFLFRPFCRFFCPLGAIYSLFSRICLVGVRVEPSRCIGCGKCVRNCRMDVRHVGDGECIHCGECIEDCPTGAIAWRLGGKPVPKSPPKRRYLAGACALLLFALLFVNLPAAPAQEDVTGGEIGMLCPDFSVRLYGAEGGVFQLEEQRGKPAVINFWATWCAPCVRELPEFQRLFQAYGDRIHVLAIHSESVTEDVQAFLDGTDFRFPFGLDEDGSVFRALGGGDLLPMTVVLDADGRIAFRQIGAIEPEALEETVRALLEESAVHS